MAQLERTVRISGSADCVIELFDNWEGMNLIAVRFGCYGGDEPVSWAGEANAIDTDLARALGEQLIKMADVLDGQS